MVWYGPWQPGRVVTVRVGLQGNFIGVLDGTNRITDAPTDGVATTEVARHEAGPHYAEDFPGGTPPWMGSEEISQLAWDQMLATPLTNAGGTPHLFYDTSLTSAAQGLTIWQQRALGYTTTWDKDATFNPSPTSAETSAAGAISWQPAMPPLVPESEVQPPEILSALLHWPAGPVTPADWLMVFRDPSNPAPAVPSDYAGLPPVAHGYDLTGDYLALQDGPGSPSFSFHFVHAAVYEMDWPGWFGRVGVEEQGNAGSPEIHLTLRGAPWRWVYPGDPPIDETIPYRRTSHRHDSLAGGATRNYPPSRALQTSNRIGGGYL